MRLSRFVFVLVGAVVIAGSGQTDFAFGQSGGEKGAGAPAAAPNASSVPATAAPKPGEPPAAAAQPKTDDFVGVEVTMTERPIIYVSSSATWDKAFETIVDSFKKVYAFLEKEKIAPAGSPMTIYTSTDDRGFQFRAAVPVAEPPPNLPEGISAAKSPVGKALKYAHRGSYDSLDSTYEAITNQLDEKGLEAQEVFVEAYLNDPRTTPDDQLAIEVYVPIK